MNKINDSNQASKGTQAIGRAAAILRALARDNKKGQGMAEIADHLMLERPTAYRILRRLVDEGLVIQNPASRSYHLGPLIYELGLLAQPPVSEIRDLSRSSLTRIAEESNDTVFLIALRGTDSVCLDRAQGNYPIQALLLNPGQRRPTGIGAGSIALLATMAADQVTAILQNNARLLIDAGESLDLVRDCIDAARLTGFALKRPPAMPDILSISSAVTDEAGRPLVALSISGLAHRITSRMDMLTKILRTETRLLRHSLAQIDFLRSPKTDRTA